MAKYTSNKSARFNLNRNKNSNTKKAKQTGIVNAGIGVIYVLLFAFIFSAYYKLEEDEKKKR